MKKNFNSLEAYSKSKFAVSSSMKKICTKFTGEIDISTIIVEDFKTCLGSTELQRDRFLQHYQALASGEKN